MRGGVTEQLPPAGRRPQPARGGVAVMCQPLRLGLALKAKSPGRARRGGSRYARRRQEPRCCTGMRKWSGEGRDRQLRCLRCAPEPRHMERDRGAGSAVCSPPRPEQVPRPRASRGSHLSERERERERERGPKSWRWRGRGRGLRRDRAGRRCSAGATCICTCLCLGGAAPGRGRDELRPASSRGGTGCPSWGCDAGMLTPSPQTHPSRPGFLLSLLEDGKKKERKKIDKQGRAGSFCERNLGD